MASWLLPVFMITLCFINCKTDTYTCNGDCSCDTQISGETCTLNCNVDDACRLDILTCRDNDVCIVNCDGRRACRGTDIICGANSDCTINCINGNNVCADRKNGADPFIVNTNNAKSYQCVGTLCPAPSPNVPAPYPTISAPSISPSNIPSKSPTSIPSGSPTNNPSTSPSKMPTTLQPTSSPSNDPSISPSNIPSKYPTKSPTNIPTNYPTTQSPTTKMPTAKVPTTKEPTTSMPTSIPSITPTAAPSFIPTIGPTTSAPTSKESTSSIPTTSNPTSTSTSNSTSDPTPKPTLKPTSNPTLHPTPKPTLKPTSVPTNNPTLKPTANPASNPTPKPTPNPISKPTSTLKPTPKSTSNPTLDPTPKPTLKPTSVPTNNPTLKPTANIIPTPTGNNNLLDITIYSRGYDDDEINNEYYSFITINNGKNVISPTQRGFNVIILDGLNGSIVDKYKCDMYNTSYSIQRDMELANYLNSVKPNDIILITVFDTVTADIAEYGRNPNYTLNVLQSFGCNISSIGYRESFIFIGSANNTNHPLWTYCESNPYSNSNGTILSDGAILKSFVIPLSMEQTTNYPSILPTASATINQSHLYLRITPSKYPTIDATESIMIEQNVGPLFNLKAVTAIHIFIAICIILLCCIIPLLIGVSICCCIYKRNQKQHDHNAHNNHEYDDNNEESKILKLPKMLSITPPGLAVDDSLKITPNSSDDRYITSPSGITCFNPITFDKKLTFSTNITLHIEGLQKHRKLDLINPSLNSDDNIEHKYNDDSDDIHLETIKCDAKSIMNNKLKLNLNGIDSGLSDGMYEINNDQHIDDKIYTLRTAQNERSHPMPNAFKLKAAQNEQTSTPNAITAESEDCGDV